MFFCALGTFTSLMSCVTFLYNVKLVEHKASYEFIK